MSPATGGPRTPGWYQDPEDPALLRHWNGRHWEARRRHIPAWSIASDDLRVLEPTDPPTGARPDSPVRTDPLPAGTASTMSSATRRRPVALPSGRGQPPGPGPSGWSPPRLPAAPGSRWAVTRRRLTAVLLVVGVVVLTLSSALTGRGGTDPLASDTVFLREANAACASAIGAVRLSLATPPSGRPAAILTANEQLTTLSARLLALARPSGANTDLTGWLTTWSAWAAARLRQAQLDAAASPSSAQPGPVPAVGTTTPAAAAASAAAVEADQADAFAAGHGLGSCTLDARAAPAMVAVP